MNYRFKCAKCGAEEERNISMEQYTEQKEKQYCSCGEKMQRIIEWQGIAQNLGGYSATSGSASWQK